MRPTDWTAYLDGSMPSEERGRLREKIGTDPAVQRDYEGFLALREAIVRAGESVAVPEAELTAFLAQTVKKPVMPPTRLWVLRLAPVLVIAAALAWIPQLMAPNDPTPAICDPIGVMTAPISAAKPLSSAAEAGAWMTSQLGLKAPTLTFNGKAFPSGVRSGVNWGRYDFYAKGSPLYVYLAFTDQFGAAPTKTIGKRTFFLLPEGIGWRQGGFSFYMEGCDGKALEELAVIAFDEIARQKLKRFGGAIVRPS